MSSVFSDSRWNTQVPVLGDEASQTDLLGEAHSDDTKLRAERLRPVRAEGPVIETASVAQSSTIDAETQSRDEDEVETDRGGEQLSSGEQCGILGRFADTPSAVGLQTGHRASDLTEHQRFPDRRDDRQIDGAARCKELVERRVEVRLSGQRRIGKEGADRRFLDDIPSGSCHRG